MLLIGGLTTRRAKRADAAGSPPLRFLQGFVPTLAGWLVFIGLFNESLSPWGPFTGEAKTLDVLGLALAFGVGAWRQRTEPPLTAARPN